MHKCLRETAHRRTDRMTDRRNRITSALGNNDVGLSNFLLIQTSQKEFFFSREGTRLLHPLLDPSVVAVTENIQYTTRSDVNKI